MDSFDVAEICEIAGLYIQSNLKIYFLEPTLDFTGMV